MTRTRLTKKDYMASFTKAEENEAKKMYNRLRYNKDVVSVSMRNLFVVKENGESIEIIYSYK